MSQEIPIHAVSTPEARKYAALIRCDMDLVHLISCADTLCSDSLPPILAQATFESLAITYRRCMKDPAKSVTKSDALAAGGSQVHDWLISMANKHVAHPVNAFEQVRIGTMIENNKVVGIGNVYMRYLTCQTDMAAKLKGYFQAIRTLLKPRLEAAHKGALEVAKTIPVEAHLRAPVLQVVMPSSADAGKPRQ